MRSETMPHNRRPTPLKSELTAISVAPYLTSGAGPKEGPADHQIPWCSDDWKPMIEIPAAMLQKSTIHIMRNWPESRYSRVETPNVSGNTRWAAGDGAGSVDRGMLGTGAYPGGG